MMPPRRGTSIVERIIDAVTTAMMFALAGVLTSCVYVLVGSLVGGAGVGGMELVGLFLLPALLLVGLPSFVVAFVVWTILGPTCVRRRARSPELALAAGAMIGLLALLIVAAFAGMYSEDAARYDYVGDRPFRHAFVGWVVRCWWFVLPGSAVVGPPCCNKEKSGRTAR